MRKAYAKTNVEETRIPIQRRGLHSTVHSTQTSPCLSVHSSRLLSCSSGSSSSLTSSGACCVGSCKVEITWLENGIVVALIWLECAAELCRLSVRREIIVTDTLLWVVSICSQVSRWKLVYSTYVLASVDKTPRRAGCSFCEYTFGNYMVERKWDTYSCDLNQS